jgi:hypothetical protein
LSGVNGAVERGTPAFGFPFFDPRTVKILDLFDALRVTDRGDRPQPQAVHESAKYVNGIFATLPPAVTLGAASSCAEGAKAL